MAKDVKIFIYQDILGKGSIEVLSPKFAFNYLIEKIQISSVRNNQAGKSEQGFLELSAHQSLTTIYATITNDSGN